MDAAGGDEEDWCFHRVASEANDLLLASSLHCCAGRRWLASHSPDLVEAERTFAAIGDIAAQLRALVERHGGQPSDPLATRTDEHRADA